MHKPGRFSNFRRRPGFSPFNTEVPTKVPICSKKELDFRKKFCYIIPMCTMSTLGLLSLGVLS